MSHSWYSGLDMKNMRQIPQTLKVVLNMPALSHWPDREQPFDISQSQVTQWLIQQPDCLSWLFESVRWRGLIVFNEESKLWEGVKDEKLIPSRKPGPTAPGQPAPRAKRISLEDFEKAQDEVDSVLDRLNIRPREWLREEVSRTCQKLNISRSSYYRYEKELREKQASARKAKQEQGKISYPTHGPDDPEQPSTSP